MLKKTISKKVFLFLIALVGFTGIKAQTCSSPITLTVNTGFTAKDSTNLFQTYYKFTATNTQHAVKFYVKNLNSPFYMASICTFSNNCGSLSTSRINSYMKTYGDTIYIDMPALSIGIDYLLELTNAFTSTYLVNRISIGNTLFGITTNTNLTCPTSSLACQSPTPCDYVCNGDFECVQVPLLTNALPYISDLYNWNSFNGNGWYFSPTNPLPNTVPCNGHGYQNAYSGNNYASLLYASNSFPQWTQDLQTKLTTPLVAGGVYQISFYCSKAEISTMTFGQIGCWLSATQMTYNPVIYTSQTTLTPSAVETNTTLINDFTNWQKITMTYTSVSGGEQYLIIGFPIGTPTAITAASSATCVGMNPNPNTSQIGSLYIDKVSLIPLMDITASASPSAICAGGTSILNASNPNPMTFTWNPGSTVSNSISVTPTTTTVYTVTGSYLGCSSTNTVVVNVSAPPFTFTPTVTNSLVCSNIAGSTTLSANYTGSPTFFLWLPGPLFGLTQAISPTVSTVYTLAIGTSTCALTNTVAVLVNTACCTSTIAPLTTTMLTGVTLTGPKVINFDLTISGTSTVTLFQNGEFLIAPNVQITVLNGGGGNEFWLKSAHLYSCGTDMWKGIDVQDGARMVSQGTFTGTTLISSSLIEDAITAVNVNSITAAAAGVPVEISNTIFNKNFVGINIGATTNTAAAIYLVSDVFTSRTLTFTSTSWPTTSTVSPGLRYASTTATAGLAPPYSMQSATITNLKGPYTGQSAQAGIQFYNVGSTISGIYYDLAVGHASVTGAYADFNVFDGLMYGIDGFNSNFSSINNVYQNMQRLYFCGPHGCVYDGGTAIRSNINTSLNAHLNLTATGTYSTSYSVGNRFWDCYRAVEATNVYKLDCNYATFRSTQTSTAATSTSFLPGNTGIINTTNRFDHTIRYNNFNNINNPVSINVNSGPYTYASTNYTGTLAGNIFVDNNYIGAQLTNTTTLGTAFVNNAIYFGSTSTTGWNFIATLGLRISGNRIDRAWRGVSVNAFAHPTFVQTNTVNLVNDATLNTTQYGINCNNVPYVSITTNTLNAVNTTNTLVTLVYIAASPTCAVSCNTLNTAYQGFVFDQNSAGSFWKGNNMTAHQRGMVLTNTAVIGTQGGSTSPIDNKWNGSWTGLNVGTYVDGTSDASNSKLWVKPGAGFFPPSPGFAFGYSAFSYSVIANTPTTTGAYTCGGGGGGGRIIIPPRVDASQNSAKIINAVDPMQYTSDNILYRFLANNDSIRNSDSAYIDFYNSKAGSSMDVFKQTETALSSGQLAQAQSLNSSVNTGNTAEANYKNYYTLYSKYQSASLTSNDSSAVLDLALLCPGTDGTIIYQARALYNLINKTVRIFNDNCSIDDGAINGQNNAKIISSENKKTWNVELFPNPTKGNFTLVSKSENEVLNVIISDVTGKVIFNKAVNTSNFIANLELNTVTGIYLISIKNNDHESITKKLVITD